MKNLITTLILITVNVTVNVFAQDTLTTQANEANTLYWLEKVNITKDFSIEFNGYFGDVDAGNGITAFVHNDSRGTNAESCSGYKHIIPNHGCAASAPGIKPSFAWEFNDGVNFLKDGKHTLETSIVPVASYTWHNIKILYYAETNVIQVYLDNILVHTSIEDLSKIGDTAYFGLSASTSEAPNTHIVENYVVIGETILSVETSIAGHISDSGTKLFQIKDNKIQLHESVIDSVLINTFGQEIHSTEIPQGISILVLYTSTGKQSYKINKHN